MNLTAESSFNTSTSFFEKLLYKELFSDLPNVSALDNEDASTVAPDSRTTSCNQDNWANLNQYFSNPSVKLDCEFAKNNLKPNLSGFSNLENGSKNMKNALFVQNDKEKFFGKKKKTLNLKNKVKKMLNEETNKEFDLRFVEVKGLIQ